MRVQVAIVGGGPAGLSCAHRLVQEGVECLVLEAADEVGGRVRTDTVEGFKLDRGFQVLLTAYPEARRVLHHEKLKLAAFYPGALVWFGGKFHRVADPWRRPVDAVGGLLSPIGTFRDKLRIGRLRHRALKTPELGLRDPEVTTLDALTRDGFSASIIERFFRPFLGGVFLETELQTSTRFFDFVFRMFASGETALPAGGMGEIPKQIASNLPKGSIRIGSRVVRVEAGVVILESGETVRADKIVAATNAGIPGPLASLGSKTSWRTTACLCFSAPRAPVEGPLLVLNGEADGPVNNLAVLTEVVPGYSQSDEALISVTVPGNPRWDDATLTQEVLRQMTGWFPKETETWRLLRLYRISKALPAFPPGSRPGSLHRQGNLIACGDSYDTPSIQGAMVSGRKSAEEILQDQAGGS